MKLIINKSIYSLTLLALMAISAASGMDQEKTILAGTLYIQDEMETALYVPKKHFTNNISKSSFQASQVDPFMLVEIRNNPADDTGHRILIPAKYLFNFNDGSKINFVFGEYKVEATCARNPLISNGKDFAAQFTHNMESFYEKPYFLPETTKELIDKGILASTVEYKLDPMFRSNKYISVANSEGIRIPGVLKAKYTNCTHGPNGCPNEIRFAALSSKTTQLYGNSVHQLVMQRPYGKPLARPKKEPSDCNIKEFNAALVPSYQTEYGKHGNECTLF